MGKEFQRVTTVNAQTGEVVEADVDLSALAEQLVAQAQSQGIELTGPDGLLTGLTRQELLLLAPDDISRDAAASLLYDAGSAALRTHMAYLRGDILGPHGHMFPGATTSALYVTAPVYFPDEFATAREAGPRCCHRLACANYDERGGVCQVARLAAF